MRGAHLKVRSEVPKDLAELIACVRGARTVAPSNNTLPRLSAIEIDIVRAQNLKQCDTFSLSDPFVVGYHGGEKIGQTKIVNDTLSPIWRDLRVLKCRGAFTPSTRLVSIRRGRWWSVLRF